uniref:Uncharacterized protein n=1 Tax=Anguilla anguilla TaxID=7936 RepID=A0A0E9XFA8_ANGAN
MSLYSFQRQRTVVPTYEIHLITICRDSRHMWRRRLLYRLLDYINPTSVGHS